MRNSFQKILMSSQLIVLARNSKIICRLKFFLAALLLVLLAGCQSPPKQPLASYESVADRQRALQSLAAWTAVGRIALSSPTEGFSAAMDWRQVNTDYDVELTALLGQRALRVTQKGPQALLKSPGRAAVTGNNAELLLLNELGVRVPLLQMSSWIKGLPGSQARPEYDDGGRLSSLAYTDEDGTPWVANFKTYQRVNDMDLPARIDISGRDYNIRLLIKRWQVVQSTTQPPSQQSPARLQIPSV